MLKNLRRALQTQLQIWPIIFIVGAAGAAAAAAVEIWEAGYCWESTWGTNNPQADAYPCWEFGHGMGRSRWR